MLGIAARVCARLSVSSSKAAASVVTVSRRWQSGAALAADDHQELQQLDKPKILITGSLGQLGIGLAKKLRLSHGNENILMSDIIKAPKDVLQSGPYIYADILDFKNLQEIVVTEQIDCIIHFSALLSAVGEVNIPLAMRVNIEGLHNVLELSKQYKLRLFVPSTIGAFGPSSPRNPTPDLTIQRPRTIYGVSKVHAELMGEYYHYKFGLDFRSLRFPGIISADTEPGGGTTDYATEIFHDALTKGYHVCPLKPDSCLPMMFIEDCLRSVIEVLNVPEDQLKMRTYNVNAMNFTPSQLADEVKKYYPKFEMHYKPDGRQNIAEDWPEVLDDENARRDWKWKHKYNIEDLAQAMFGYLQPLYNKQGKLHNY